MPPLPTFISQFLSSPTVTFLSPHHSIPIHIPHRLFHHPHAYCMPAQSPYPTLSLFCTIYSHPPATNTIPHPSTSFTIASICSLTSSCPIPYPCYCLPPTPHFRIFD